MKRFFSLESVRTALGVVVAVIVVGGGAYAYVAYTGAPKYETIVVAPQPFVRQVSLSGKVEPAQDVDLGFSQSGRISKVYVTVGKKVRAGDLLAEVDNADVAAVVAQRQASLASEEAKLASLRSGTRPEEVAVAEAQVSDAEIARTQARQAIIDALQSAYAAGDSAVRLTVDQFFYNPRSVSPKTTIVSSNSQLIYDVESKRAHLEGQLTQWQSEVNVLTVTSDLALAATKGQGYLAEVTSLLSIASSLLSQAFATQTITQTSLDTYAQAVSTARTTINTKISALTSATTAERGAASTLNTAQKNLALKQAGTRVTDIEAQEAAVAVAKAAVADAQAQLQKTAIRAPFDGTVTAVNAKAGKIVSPNSHEISLITNDTFHIEAFVPEINIAQLKVGDPAQVTLDAYGAESLFAAKLLSIDPAETVRDGVSTYRALLYFLSPDERIRAGMTASALVTTDAREGVLSVPQGAVLERNGNTYVETLQNGVTVERPVSVGAVSSFGEREITAGLVSGDVVILPSM